MRKGLLCLLILLMPILLFSEKSVRLYKTVHFKGLHTLSKYDIAKSAGMRSKDDMIAVDVKRLAAVLENESVIKEYRLHDDDTVLTIEISEFSPEYVIFLAGSKTNIFCEADQSFRIISRGTLHRGETPLIVLHKRAVDAKRIVREYRARIEFMKNAAQEIGLWDQMKQIDFAVAGSIRITLNKRRTEFILSADEPELKRLKTTIGYLDAVERYPATLDIRGRIAVIR